MIVSSVVFGATEVVEAGGSILFRNVRLNRRRRAEVELKADVAVTTWKLSLGTRMRSGLRFCDSQILSLSIDVV